MTNPKDLTQEQRQELHALLKEIRATQTRKHRKKFKFFFRNESGLSVDKQKDWCTWLNLEYGEVVCLQLMTQNLDLSYSYHELDSTCEWIIKWDQEGGKYYYDVDVNGKREEVQGVKVEILCQEKFDKLMLMYQDKPSPGERKDTKTPTYKWEYKEKEQTVSCNGKRPVRLEPRLFRILQKLHDSKEKRVSWRDLKDTAKVSSRGAVRDAVSDVKIILVDEFKIDRDELDKIIEPKKDKNRKITHYIFHT